MKKITSFERLQAERGIRLCAEIMPKMMGLHALCENLADDFSWESIFFEEVAVGAMHVGRVCTVLAERLLDDKGEIKE